MADIDKSLPNEVEKIVSPEENEIEQDWYNIFKFNIR